MSNMYLFINAEKDKIEDLLKNLDYLPIELPTIANYSGYSTFKKGKVKAFLFPKPRFILTDMESPTEKEKSTLKEIINNASSMLELWGNDAKMCLDVGKDIQLKCEEDNLEAVLYDRENKKPYRTSKRS